MSYYVLEVEPTLAGDDALLKSYVQLFSASDNLNLLTHDAGGGVTHLMIELPNSNVRPFFDIVSGPMSEQAARDYLVANAW